VSLGRVEGPLRGEPIRKISELVENYPNESLAVIRGWLSAEVAK